MRPLRAKHGGAPSRHPPSSDFAQDWLSTPGTRPITARSVPQTDLVREDVLMPQYFEVLQQVRGTADALAGLRAHDATWTGPPVGSAMAADDEIWPLMPCSETVRTALLCAHDHLDLVRVVLLQVQPAPPSATYSALRGALVGSCIALWVVGCDDDEVRRARALALVDEDYKYRHAFHASQMQSEDPARAEHSRPWVERWKGRRRELTAVRQGLPNASPKVTSIVEWVARERFGSGTDSYATLLGLWQSSRSSAHGLGWGAFVRPGLDPVGHDSARGLSAFNVALDIDDAADRYLTCVAVLMLADGLFRQRCSE